MVRILVISSCTKKKAFNLTNAPTCKEIHSKKDREELLRTMPDYSCAVKDMYQGAQHVNILRGIKILRSFTKVEFHVLSAGFGLLEEHDQVPVYECSFRGMKKRLIQDRAERLGIREDFQELVVDKSYDLIYLALGADYLKALDNWDEVIESLAIAFTPTKQPNILALRADGKLVAKLSSLGFTIHGVVGLKGDLLRILAEQLEKKEQPRELLAEILTDKKSLATFFQNELFQVRQTKMTHFLL